ncbi:MAG: glycosyltransferase [Vicinamibacteria bacterium]|nr:glycosyltransferase [Vicinamibacteria bacterium]
MRRVLVVTSGALFVRGGHLVIAEEIVAALRRQDREAELLVTPQNRFGRQLSAYLASRLTDVGMTADGRGIDGVVSLRFPSYAVRHPFHVCWINHRMREYYDLWEDLVRGLGRKGRIKERIRRRMFHAIDRWLLTRNVTRVVAQSRTIQFRLERFGGIPSEVLHPPAPERNYRNDDYGESIFAVSRLDRLKRLDLLVESAAHVKNRSLHFRIAGEGPEASHLRARIRELGLESRVELLGPISEDALLTELSRCRAVFFAPKNEDYGLVTLQAFRSAKAVLTANDSGGPTELVRDGENGFIVAPDPIAVAEKLEALGEDRTLAERLGQAALADSRAHTWERAIRVLLRDGSEGALRN